MEQKHIYINPITGRNIHENNKTYRELKKSHYKLKKSPCLYNEKAAKKCLEKIMKHYPKLPILSKTLLNNITVIRNKNGLIHGVVNSNGQMYKLEYPIRVDKVVPELVTVSEDHNTILNNKLNTSDIISSEYILNKLNNQISGENVTYNPLHDNYTEVVSTPILNEINKQVIPETLPTTNGIAGVIRNQDNLDEITGYINEKNEALKLNTTLNVKVSELQKELSSKDTEINNLKNEIQQKINFGGSDLNKLNTLLITKENEKQQLEKQCTEKIKTLYSQLGELNVKIPKLEESSDYYYSLIKRTLEKWNPIEDDHIDKSYATWLKNLFVGNKVLQKTDNIEENLDVLVERGNMYANSKRTNIELQKINDEYKSSLDKLNEQLLEYPYQKIQIQRLTKDLDTATKQYKNSKITRDLLIASYEKSIKGYLDAIESLKENNVNIGVEMGLLKNKYNDIKELQEQLKNKNSQDTDTEYNFITKYFNVSQDYSTLSNLIKKHELAFQELQDKNTLLETSVKDLQRKLKETSNVNIVNNLDRYKKAFKEIQTKYNNLVEENNNNLKKIIESQRQNENVNENLSELTLIQNELKKCKEEKIQKEKELSEQASNFISLPRSVTDTLPTENSDSIKKELTQRECSGYLTNEFGVKSILKWNDQVQKCIQEEVKCNNGEMYSESKGKCLPCEEFDLIWDPITKKCIQQSINLLVDQNNNIIGETEDDNWTEVRRKKNKPWK